MPTETFFRLPEDKRQRLTEAIKSELQRVPFERVSINQIVQKARIPRGSFYQYFEDKEDMLEYILSGYQQKLFENIKCSLKRSEGNIFILFSDIFDFIVSFVENGENNRFCRNLFSDIKVNSRCHLKFFQNVMKKQVYEQLRTDAYSRYDFLEEEDFIDMVGILFSVCRDATVNVFLTLSEAEEIRRSYQRKLNLLERHFITVGNMSSPNDGTSPY